MRKNKQFLDSIQIDFAKYIVAVSQDDELFASFFWWRTFYQARPCGSRYGMEIACHTETFTQVNQYFFSFFKLCRTQVNEINICCKHHNSSRNTKIYINILTCFFWWQSDTCLIKFGCCYQGFPVDQTVGHLPLLILYFRPIVSFVPNFTKILKR